MTMPGHSCRAHRRFRLNCTQFDELRRETGEQCQLCGSSQSGRGERAMSIDHDSTLGYWAVRGMLCAACNVYLPQMADERARQYVDNPWWKRAGIPPRSVADDLVIPAVAQEDALADLDVAHTAYLAALNLGTTQALKDARHELKHAVRVALKSGMRQADVARAINQTWNKDQVYAACFEKGRRVV